MRAVFLSTLSVAMAAVHPISTYSTQFIDSVTGDPFFIQGVDYQPGGSSGYLEWADPLSDVDSCARDIFLFQQLGINTIRVYTVNPALNHDACMTMLAAAGIYLILDVNSPKVGESINRYEPWTTYNPDYLRHVFQVVEQFSWYNNTLGYFIGNEIVNDERSASVSPAYIRAVTRDVKAYIELNSPRPIPVGYSAADDLRYRVPLAHYLTCGEEDSAVDFYGVNSYQWCGHQTYQTSGYDVLVKDHEQFTVPVFFSEFGCNIVQPRSFQEIEVMFTPVMASTFSGGLVYEFTQEPNNYGLVELDARGSANLLPDFDTLRAKFAAHKVDTTQLATVKDRPRLACRAQYEHLDQRLEVPESFGTDMIRNGVRATRGRYLMDLPMPASSLHIYNEKGESIEDRRIRQTVAFGYDGSDVEDVPEMAAKPVNAKPPARETATSLQKDSLQGTSNVTVHTTETEPENPRATRTAGNNQGQQAGRYNYYGPQNPRRVVGSRSPGETSAGNDLVRFSDVAAVFITIAVAAIIGLTV